MELNSREIAVLIWLGLVFSDNLVGNRHMNRTGHSRTSRHFALYSRGGPA